VSWALRAGIAAALCATLAPAPQAQAPARRGSSFAGQIAALSEQPGYFDTDNLISNERSYQQVLQELTRRKVRGGAYVGVGPDQNFTYIAEVRPAIAFVIDVRRDNLLLHLLFKALFALSRTRIDYLAQLTGRPMPSNIEVWRGATIERLIAYVDRSAASPAAVTALMRRVNAEIEATGVPLSAEDRATIDRFRRRFITDGLALMFESHGRAPQGYNPTYRDLLREVDESGRQAGYLASEDAFQFLKSLQARDLVVPVVGDLSGPTAIRAIGTALTARNERLSAIYVSNVEFYLFRYGTFGRWADNLARLPHAPNSVVIRSVFGRSGGAARPADASVSRVQDVAELLRAHAAGGIRSYGDVVR
jgi:hypothetical protein